MHQIALQLSLKKYWVNFKALKSIVNHKPLIISIDFYFNSIYIFTHDFLDLSPKIYSYLHHTLY